ncbi:class I SAM-dependent RNA methyltransferase [Cryobacterium sp. TMT1-3]|uniref:Class I SAM-dependent RNA methyltransferase n=1 Tax=Cryobacterium luteum TaxID=1424661 RepID=A0A1H8CGX8_9MICO|nr:MULTISPECIES: TRAM domain-containing protein [Cryobacterium]TFB89372.1 class I SAM-dependent RNA methyltransferase [Cryobacterium luteum]TFC27334.1 class I SAM-dependent RNA methyltransferase [Cryobacterium sp. TMT1-3]SEM94333.1 tRNA/tmRNA/rRNA uracil-C5-methylase, TrmA/RlmC/RlmD family [Cryobacterium luteum]
MSNTSSQPATPAPTSSATVGDELELDITNVAHGGIFIARHEGRVIFVSDTLPGERVRARLTEANHKSFWRAETVAVIDAATERQPHIWSAASVERAPEDRAGGAEFGHIELGFQRELKRQVLADALQRMAGIVTDVVVEPVAVSAKASPGDAMDGTGWRTRVSLHVADDGTIGPYAARSHRVIPVDDLPLAEHELELRAPLDTLFHNAAKIDLVAPSKGDVQVLVSAKDATGKPKRVPHGLIHEIVADREFELDRSGFWQVHSMAADTLYHAVQNIIDPNIFDPRASNLDLYGGVGLLAAAVGDRFGSTTRITSVESDPDAVAFAARNLKEWAGATAEADRVDRFLQRLLREADAAERARLAAATVVLDPPRSGAGAAVVDQLVTLAPQQIVYVACDPVALARDVALFAKQGYQLKTLRAFDLFPNTHHVEAVALLCK